MHKSIAIRRRKTDCNACPDSSDPAGATPGADPPYLFARKTPGGVERGHHRVDLGLPPFPLAYFLGTSFPGIFGYRGCPWELLMPVFWPRYQNLLSI